MTQGPHLPGSLGNFSTVEFHKPCAMLKIWVGLDYPVLEKDDHFLGIYVAMVAMDFQYDQYGMTLPPKNHHIPSNLTMAHIIIIIVSTRSGIFHLHLTFLLKVKDHPHPRARSVTMDHGRLLHK